MSSIAKAYAHGLNDYSGKLPMRRKHGRCASTSALGEVRSATVPMFLPPGGIALLGPGLAAHMVAVPFPEAGLVVIQELQASHPLHALPEIEVRHYQAER